MNRLFSLNRCQLLVKENYFNLCVEINIHSGPHFSVLLQLPEKFKICSWILHLDNILSNKEYCILHVTYLYNLAIIK